MSQSQIDSIVHKLNDRATKCLGFKIHNEVFVNRFGIQDI